MSYAGRAYDVYLALGDPHATPLWAWIAWQRLLPDIDPLIKAAHGKPSLRSTQFLPGRPKTVKFGRLGWKDSDHQKWCHGSPSNEAESCTWTFRNVEIWRPLGVCANKKTSRPMCSFQFRTSQPIAPAIAISFSTPLFYSPWPAN